MEPFFNNDELPEEERRAAIESFGSRNRNWHGLQEMKESLMILKSLSIQGYEIRDDETCGLVVLSGAEYRRSFFVFEKESIWLLKEGETPIHIFDDEIRAIDICDDRLYIARYSTDEVLAISIFRAAENRRKDLYTLFLSIQDFIQYNTGTIAKIGIEESECESVKVWSAW